MYPIPKRYVQCFVCVSLHTRAFRFDILNYFPDFFTRSSVLVSVFFFPCNYVFQLGCVVLFPGAIHDDPTRAATGGLIVLNDKIKGKICVMILFIVIPREVIVQINACLFFTGRFGIFLEVVFALCTRNDGQMASWPSFVFA